MFLLLSPETMNIVSLLELKHVAWFTPHLCNQIERHMQGEPKQRNNTVTKSLTTDWCYQVHCRALNWTPSLNDR